MNDINFFMSVVTNIVSNRVCIINLTVIEIV